MAAALRRWIRVDVGWSDSGWVGELEPAARLAWIELLTYVKRDGTAGVVKALTPTAFGRKVRIPKEDIAAMLEAAVADDALRIEDGDWVVSNWSEYQDVDGTTNERSRRYRASKSRLSPSRRDNRDGPLQGVTGRDEPLRGVAGRGDRHATSTSTSTVTETETEKERLSASSSSGATHTREPRPVAGPADADPIRSDDDNFYISILNRLEPQPPDRILRFRPDAKHRAELAGHNRDLRFEYQQCVLFWARSEWPNRPGAAFMDWCRKEEETYVAPAPGSEYAVARQRNDELPRDNGPRSGVLTTVNDANRKEADDVARRIADWQQANPDMADQLMRRVAAELNNDPAWKGVPNGRLLEAAAKIKYRSAVLEQLEGA